MRIFRTYYSRRHLRAADRKIAGIRHSALIKKNKDRRILVVLHLFYPESWKEIREYLLNFSGYSLYSGAYAFRLRNSVWIAETPLTEKPQWMSMAAMCAPYGTKLDIRNGIGVVEL